MQLNIYFLEEIKTSHRQIFFHVTFTKLTFVLYDNIVQWQLSFFHTVHGLDYSAGLL